jgi:CTP synthase
MGRLPMRKPRVAVFVSGGGSNLQALIDAAARGEIAGEIGLVVSDRPECGGVARALAAGLPVFTFRPRDGEDRETRDREIAARCEEADCSLVVLAGFMRLLSPWFVARFQDRIVNTHPSLLPAFPGTRAVRDALAAGVAETGCTVHFVDEGIDTGPIIAQTRVPILPGDSEKSLADRIRAREHAVYPRVVDRLCRGMLLDRPTASAGRGPRLAPPRFVFLTGGVMSSLGKGITSASLGNLLKARGFRIGIMKLDPYINVDPGTMSPYQHGEVYVTRDGAETDLDIGHYERFLDADLTRAHNMTTGQVYDAVIRRERAGDYLGKTVQVIPHVTDEIKARIVELALDFDCLIVEIGGTVGDIESLPFLEAIRQLRRERGPEHVAYLHLTLVPWHAATGEMKTKPTQHSVAALRQIGIQPNVLLCRSARPLEEEVRAKIALFADVRVDEVVSLPDVDSIYRVPEILREAGLDEIVLRTLGLPEKGEEDPAGFGEAWEHFTARLAAPTRSVTIGMVGKYIELKDAYKSVSEAVLSAATHHGARAEIRWIDAEDFERGTAETADLGGLIVPGGFGERGVEGKIAAIRAARESGLPFLGICLGLQCAVVEFARNVCGLARAHSVEFDEETPHPVIHIMAAQRAVRDKGGTMRLGAYECRLRPGTAAAGLYRDYAGKAGAVAEAAIAAAGLYRDRDHASRPYSQKIPRCARDDNNWSHCHSERSEESYPGGFHETAEIESIAERHRHRYEVNNAYRDRLAEKGLIFSGLSPDGLLVELIELPAHPWFFACQFHPEFRSRPTAPHPLFLGLLQAALEAPPRNER